MYFKAHCRWISILQLRCMLMFLFKTHKYSQYGFAYDPLICIYALILAEFITGTKFQYFRHQLFMINFNHRVSASVKPNFKGASKSNKVVNGQLIFLLWVLTLYHPVKIKLEIFISEGVIVFEQPFLKSKTSS